jgi:hypothetical protein
MVITGKKKHCEKKRRPINSNFKNFVFKGILIVLLCFLIIYILG